MVLKAHAHQHTLPLYVTSFDRDLARTNMWQDAFEQLGQALALPTDYAKVRLACAKDQMAYT